MAPNFFQKLAKVGNSNNNTRERYSSESSVPSSGGFSIGRNRSHSASINSGGSNVGSSTNTTNTLNSRRSRTASSASKHAQESSAGNVPYIVTTQPDGSNGSHVAGESRGRSLDTLATVSTQPGFTIVPPSPQVRYKDLDSESDEDEQEPGPFSVAQSGTRPSVPAAKEDEQVEDLVTPTPTPTVPKPNPITSSTTPPTTNAKPEKPKTMSTTANGSLAPGPYQVRKQTSDKSIGKKKSPPSELQIATPVNHTRSATAPPEVSPPVPNHGAASTQALVESPTELHLPPNPITESSSSPASPPQNLTSPSTLGIQRENTVSAGSDGKSSGKRPWRRSTTRKPTGLASAIAASGLAMANPSLSAAQVAQAAAQISPPNSGQPSASSSRSMGNLSLNGSAPGSPPYLSKSPAQSAASQRSSAHGKARSADLSPKSSKSRKSDAGKSPTRRRTRRASGAASAKSDDGRSDYSALGTATTMNGTSANGDEALRPDYYSGLDLDDDSSSEDDMSGSDLYDGEYGEGDDLDDIPVTGFAVASNKRNADFHEVFPTVPEGDYLIEDYGCALQREILIQGRIYISENHICFHANIFGWITDLSIPIYEITSLEKKMTAFVIPNAIQITTRQAKYTFTSFLSRDTTFDVIFNIWRLARPDDNASLLSSGRGSLDGPPAVAGLNGLAAGAVVGSAAAAQVPVRKATQCACGRDGKHYSETPMEVVLPGTPEKIYNLLFASGFIKDFMTENQKLMDIQMSDWSPITPGSKLLTRNMSYIKPLSGSLGPKQTKCEIKDELEHCDFEDYVSMVTTTRNPDVPSGGVFAVKTRTCVMWASPVSSKVVVTTQVEWSGRSFIKGIIERSAIDGQKVYHVDLEKAMRAYIQEHQSEFLPEGVEVASVPVVDEPVASTGVGGATADGTEEKHHLTADENKRRERERNARGLQWAWDTFDGAYQVALRSTKGALELVRDAWDQSTSTTILWFVIVILVFSNLWTLLRVGSSKADVAKKIELKKVEDREKWVQSIVTALWDEMSTGKEIPKAVAGQTDAGATATAVAVPTPTATTVPTSVAVDQAVLSDLKDALTDSPVEALKVEVRHLKETLDTLEERIKVIKESLTGLEKLD